MSTHRVVRKEREIETRLRRSTRCSHPRGRRLSQRRWRLRPGLSSRPVWWMPAQWRRRRQATRGRASGGRGAARQDLSPRLPLDLWTLPSDLIPIPAENGAVSIRIDLEALAPAVPRPTAMAAPPGGERRGHPAGRRWQGAWGGVPRRAFRAATIGAGAKAGRAIVHRAAATIGAAVPAGAAATGDQDHFGRCALGSGGCQRHRL